VSEGRRVGSSFECFTNIFAMNFSSADDFSKQNSLIAQGGREGGGREGRILCMIRKGRLLFICNHLTK
jgi:hypothetical protein